MTAFRLHRSAFCLAFASLVASGAHADDPSNAGVATKALSPYGNALFTNPHPNPAGELYSSGLVSGDFNNDGIDDLAISENGSSRVRILIGLPWTVTDAPGAVRFTETTVATSFYNYTMATGDFDGDGRDELALGADGVNNAEGAVYVWDRLPNGTWQLQETIQASGAYIGAAQADAQLGHSLAAGDFDADGFDDLAIGIIGQIVGGVVDAGAVMVTYGSDEGITPTGSQLYNRSNDGLTFTPTTDDRFGWSLAAGDFDDDGDDDLAIGILRGTCPNGTDRAGAVLVMTSTTVSGVTNSESRIFRPGIVGMPGTCSPSMQFGSELEAATFDDGGTVDLAIGAPLGGDGAVYVVYGGDDGLAAAGAQRLVAPATAGLSSDDSRFGSALAHGRFKDCFICSGTSLVIGAEQTDVNGIVDAGAVWIVDSSVSGPLNLGSIRAIVPSAELGIGGPHADDEFGSSLAVGDFNDDGGARDLAIGVPYYDAPAGDSGAVQLLYDGDYDIFDDGFE